MLIIIFIVIGVKGQGKEESKFDVGQDQKPLGYSNWILNSLNNTSSDIFWKNGLWQMYKMFKPLANFDKRREPNFIAFNAQDSTMTVCSREFRLKVFLITKNNLFSLI